LIAATTIEVSVVVLDVGWSVVGVSGIPVIPFRFGVEEDHIVNGPEATRAAVGVRPFPDDLVSEVLGPKHVIEQELQIVARRGIAVKVDGAVLGKATVHFLQTRRHHYQVGGQLTATQTSDESKQKFLDRSRYELW